ncbi:hypothetical protein LRS13_19900 [Svornostia abyssi]|uniref:Uncharacterized protein n=1 Tax=Svornostia abyssi TaxID=2898438 RepID=A0ABY5PE12_9ACTN|nr:hypothetical protein LRS13_19900 [Parviterribacteraceae bacterium J379]
MDLGLTDKACIVTGASRGIGLATTELLRDARRPRADGRAGPRGPAGRV